MKKNFLNRAIALSAAFFIAASVPVMADGMEFTGTITAGKVNEVDVTNEYILQDLVIAKEVRGEDDGTEFEITLTISGLSSGAVIYTSEGKIIADEDGEAEETFYLANGESVTIYDLPKGTVYQATEGAVAGYVASYNLTDAGDGGEIASASGSNTGENTALSTQQETVDKDEEITVTFINTEYVQASVLPSTGGIGRYVLVAASLAGLLAVCLFFARGRRKTVRL